MPRLPGRVPLSTPKKRGIPPQPIYSSPFTATRATPQYGAAPNRHFASTKGGGCNSTTRQPRAPISTNQLHSTRPSSSSTRPLEERSLSVTPPITSPFSLFVAGFQPGGPITDQNPPPAIYPLAPDFPKPSHPLAPAHPTRLHHLFAPFTTPPCLWHSSAPSASPHLRIAAASPHSTAPASEPRLAAVPSHAPSRQPRRPYAA